VEEGLWDGVARGLITADGWGAVRSLLNARTRVTRRRRPSSRPGSHRRGGGTWRQPVEGRWTLLPSALPIEAVDELAETVAWQLLLRWGVVFRDVYLKERLGVPWREILWALRRLEARGLVRGGHFVTGVTGEQFAEETTIPLLRPRRAPRAFAAPSVASVDHNGRRPAQALTGSGGARVALADGDG
jgi:ATP-dependent Lhr-like helicase